MDALLAHCSALFTAHGSMFAVFFVGGLTGSLTHCLMMCGPVVACQSACGQCSRSNTTQIDYHLGRFITYGVLGFLAALFGKQIAALSMWPTLSSLMLVTAGSMFLASAFFPGRHAGFTGTSHFLRGLLMGFMPCGLLYAALMMAATLATPFAGMMAMWLFVLGTLPALLLASGSASLLAKRWQRWIRPLGQFGMAANGIVLLATVAGMMH